MLKTGDSLPNFSLPDQAGVTHTPAEFAGKWLVVYFYPKDDTPGCTAEACGLRDRGAEFAAHNVAIIGISKDSVKSHAKFAEKYHLQFLLLSDPTGETIKQFGAWGTKKFMGREYEGILRTTFLIDPAGKIAKIYEKVSPLNHAQQILGDLAELVPANV